MREAGHDPIQAVFFVAGVCEIRNPIYTCIAADTAMGFIYTEESSS
jgi:hypothetical protein